MVNINDRFDPGAAQDEEREMERAMYADEEPTFRTPAAGGPQARGSGSGCQGSGSGSAAGFATGTGRPQEPAGENRLVKQANCVPWRRPLQQN